MPSTHRSAVRTPIAVAMLIATTLLSGCACIRDDAHEGLFAVSLSYDSDTKTYYLVELADLSKMTCDRDSALIVPTGRYLWPIITVPSSTAEIIIDPEGQVFSAEANGERIAIGAIQFAKFDGATAEQYRRGGLKEPIDPERVRYISSMHDDWPGIREVRIPYKPPFLDDAHE